MDGSNAAFLLEPAYLSSREHRPLGGILYVEDFDADPASAEILSEDVPEIEPVYSAGELEAARQEGREEGARAALADAHLVQAQVQSAVLQSLADGLAASRAALDGIAVAHANETSRALLAVLQAALPAAMRTCAAGELQAMLQALLPGLTCEPELRVRAAAEMADMVRETLIRMLPSDTCVLAVCADPDLAAGDILVAWQDGRARRDTAAIWTQIRAALAPLALPTLKEICHAE